MAAFLRSLSTALLELLLEVELRFQQMIAHSDRVAEFHIRFGFLIVRLPSHQPFAVRVAGRRKPIKSAIRICRPIVRAMNRFAPGSIPAPLSRTRRVRSATSAAIRWWVRATPTWTSACTRISRSRRPSVFSSGRKRSTCSIGSTSNCRTATARRQTSDESCSRRIRASCSSRCGPRFSGSV